VNGSQEDIQIGGKVTIKKFSTKILLTIAAVLGMASTLLHAKEVSTMIRVPAMDCAACTVVIKKALTQTKGVKKVDLDVDRRIATVVYDDAQVTQAEIKKTIEKTGFKTEESK
jgi:copper chaperone CopZ